MNNRPRMMSIVIIAIFISAFLVGTAYSYGDFNKQPWPSGYSEVGGADDAYIGFYSDSGYSTLAEQFAQGDTIYIRLNTTDVSDCNDKNQIRFRGYDNTQIGTDQTFSCSSIGGRWVCDASYALSSGNGFNDNEWYGIDAQCGDTSTRVKGGGAILVGTSGASSHYIRLYSDSTYTSESVWFNSSSRLYYKVYGSGDTYSVADTSPQVSNLFDSKGTFTETCTQNGNEYSCNIDVNEVGGYNTEGYWYFLDPKMKDSGGTNKIYEKITAFFLIDNTGPTTSSAVASPNPTGGTGSVTVNATVDDSASNNATVNYANYTVYQGNTCGGAVNSTGTMSPSDGTYDSSVENVTTSISTTTWVLGSNYTVCITGRDIAYNFGGVASVTVEHKTLNKPPTTPTNIQCDGSNNCNITVDTSVVLNASGSTDADGDNITYFIEATLQNITTITNATPQQLLGDAGSEGGGGSGGATGDGLMIYADTDGDTSLTWRTWDTAHTLSTTSTLSPAMNAYPYLIFMEANPANASEINILMIDAGTASANQAEVKAFVFDNGSSSFDSGTSFTTTAPAIAGVEKVYISAALGIEGSSGDALVVYSDNTDLLYRTKTTGGSWSTASTLQSGDISISIDVSCDKDSDNCIAIWADNDGSNYPVKASVWDGTSWGTVTTMDSTSIYSNGVKELSLIVGAGFEGTSGDIVTVWTDGNGDWRYNTYTTSWGTSATITALTSMGAVAKPSGIRVEGDPNSNNVAVHANDGNGKDTEVVMWSGTSWGTATVVCNGNAPTDCDGSKAPSFDIAWDNNSKAHVYISDKDNGGMRYTEWTSGGGWTAPANRGAIVYKGSGVDMDTHYNSDRLFVMMDDKTSGNQYGYFTIKDGTWSSETTISITGSTNKPRQFALAYFDGGNVAGGGLTQTNQTNSSYINYTDIGTSALSVTEINITTEIDSYNPTGSVNQSTLHPNLLLEVWNSTDWITFNLSLADIYTGDALNLTDANVTVIINSSNYPDILTAWQTAANQDIRYKAVSMDWSNSTAIDEINISGFYASMTGTLWSEIGNHTETTTLFWNTTALSEQTCINLRSRAIDVNGTNTYSNYYTKGSCLNISHVVAVNNPPNIILNSPANQSVIDTTYTLLNITVTDPENDNSTVYIFAGNETGDLNTKDGLVYMQQNVPNGTDVTYNFTAMPVQSDEDGLVLLMHFDNRSEWGENDTYVYDFSGSGNNGTCTNCPAFNMTSGKFAGAFEYDGVDDFILVNKTVSGTMDSASLWFYNNDILSKSSLQQWLLSFNYASGGSAYLAFGPSTGFITDEIISVGVPVSNDKSGWCSATDSIPIGWHHLATSFNGSIYEIWLDGERKDNCYAAAPMPRWSGSIEAIGSDGDGDFANFNGTIDEVAIYNRSLSNTEILNHYRLGEGKYYWKANATDSNNANGASGTREFTIGQTISSCTIISSPGVYNLIADIFNSGSSSCINITASDVIFDGQGYTVDGVSGYSGTGVYVYNSAQSLTSVTVKNLVMGDWMYPIYYNNTENGTIENNNNPYSSANRYGIVLFNSNNTILRDNTASTYIPSVSAIYLDESNNNTIIGNTISLFGRGISLWESNNNKNNNIYNNTVNYATWGFEIGSGNTVSNNTAYGNSYGFSIYGSTASNNTAEGNNIGFSISGSSNITNNTANSNTQYGIEISGSGNTVSNNTANSNTQNGIYIADSFYNSFYNIITNNTANSNGLNGISSDPSTSLSYNIIANNTLKENGQYDLILPPLNDMSCNNLVENNTGSGDRPIRYINSTTNFQDETVSELILCNADNSNITNVTIVGSATKKNNGLLVYRTSDSNFTNINSSNNYIGIYLLDSNSNILANNTANSNGENGIRIASLSNYNNLTDNTANSNTQSGISIGATNNIIANNTVNSNDYGISGWSSSTYTNNTVLYNAYGIKVSNSNNLTFNNVSYNFWWGLQPGSSNTITNNTVTFNKFAGIYFTPENRETGNSIVNNALDDNGVVGIYAWDEGYDNTTLLGANTVDNNTYGGDRYEVYVLGDSQTGWYDCRSCHASSYAPINLTSFVDSRHFKLNNISVNENGACWACHNNGTAPKTGEGYNNMGFNTTATNRPWPCHECHVPNGTEYGKYPAPVVANHVPTNVTFYNATLKTNGTRAYCTDCHKNSMGDTGGTEPSSTLGLSLIANVSHYARNDTLMTSNPSENSTNCIYCHGNTTYDSPYNETWGGAVQPRYTIGWESMGSPITNSECWGCHVLTPITNTTLHSVGLSLGLGNPNCILCHDVGNTVTVNVTSMNSTNAMHRLLNNRSTDPGNKSDPNQVYDWNNRRCWACHNNGSAPTSSQGGGMGENKTTPWKCWDCHVVNNSFIGERNSIFNWAPNVTEHTMEQYATDINTNTRPSTGKNGTCPICHVNDMGVTSGTIPKSGGMLTASLIANVSHYGQNDSLMTPNVNSTRCFYCHNDTTNASKWGGAAQIFDDNNGMYQANETKDCWWCHTDNSKQPTNFHSPVLSISTTKCELCHFKYKYFNATRKSKFINETKFNESVHWNSSVIYCTDCHTNMSFGSARNETHPYQLEGATFLPPESGWKWCEDCHIYQAPYPNETQQRHNITSEPQNYQVYNKTGDLQGVLDIIDCTTCHNATNYNYATAMFNRTSGKDCRWCHSFPEQIPASPY